MLSAETAILSLNRLSRMLCIPRNILEDLAANAVRHYNPFLLVRSGKRPRRIDNPDRPLKNAQRRINRILFAPLVFPDFLHGGIRGRSSFTNASAHLGKRLVVKIDLESFFPSIADRQVCAVWRRLGCSPPVAAILTPLTTYHGHLPQGAPTSSSLANLVLMEQADAKIFEAASKAGCAYTRYVDDLAISGDSPDVLIATTLEALRAAGFRISRRKLELMPASTYQELTGLCINSPRGPSIPQWKRDRIRAAIHQLKALPLNANFDRAVNSIVGRIGQVAQTNEGAARKLLRLLDNIVSAVDVESRPDEET